MSVYHWDLEYGSVKWINAYELTKRRLLRLAHKVVEVSVFAKFYGRSKQTTMKKRRGQIIGLVFGFMALEQKSKGMGQYLLQCTNA